MTLRDAVHAHFAADDAFGAVSTADVPDVTFNQLERQALEKRDALIEVLQQHGVARHLAERMVV